MNVVIIEDERLAAQKLSRTLKEIVPEVEISSIIPSVEKAVDFFARPTDTDLVFMDIQLEDGICFEIFEKIKVEIPVIFTTAFDEYTLKAFKQNSIDYLLKPVKRDELESGIEKFRNLHQKVSLRTLQKMINDLNFNGYKERFLIKVGEHYKSIGIKSISCFFVKENCTFLNVEGDRIFGIEYSLDKIEDLINPKDFFRVNRNFIVRFDAIDNIISYSSNRLRIGLRGFRENEEIIVSRERVRAFKEWMDR